MAERVHIRPIKLGDALKLRRLFKKVLYRDFSYFPGEYLEQVERQNSLYKLGKAIISKNRLLLGLYNKRKLVGYVIADMHDPKENYVFWLYVSPDMRGGGNGADLFNKALDSMSNRGAHSVYLMTHSNEDFYKSFGFDTIHSNSNVFEGITMHEMAKDFR
jgi:ribosomal protein S18 acetylase RimI-like enzyme